ncbi:MAG: hypothetical protein J6U54_03385 [Clostridiales bacterium]|nr:hypothetical protein [Clostridiales bacterium]
MADMTPADLAAINNGGFGENSMFFWIFALMLLPGIGGGRFAGAGPQGNYVTQAELTAGLNNQAVQAQLQQISLSSANNNYETSRLIDQQTNLMLQQQNAGQINAIQGFNAINLNLTNLANGLSNKMDQAIFQLQQCCCDIKTQMLQDRLADKTAELTAAQNAINNAAQTQTLLSQMGRWVGWATSGTAGTAATGS